MSKKYNRMIGGGGGTTDRANVRLAGQAKSTGRALWLAIALQVRIN